MPCNRPMALALTRTFTYGSRCSETSSPCWSSHSSATCRTRSAASGALLSGLLSFGYLYAISIKNVPLAILLSLLMWGVVYQGYNAIFPSFYPELFPTRTRVSAMAISQNIGTTITALLPALFATVAPPGSANIPLTVGAIAFGITVIAALAAVTARETYRIGIDDLGNPNAVPMAKADYERKRAETASRAAAVPT